VSSVSGLGLVLGSVSRERGVWVEYSAGKFMRICVIGGVGRWGRRENLGVSNGTRGWT